MSAELFHVIIRSLTPFDLEFKLKEKVTESVFYFESAIRSQYFKDSILNFNQSSDGFNKRYNMNLNNAGVYNKVLNAIEINGNILRNTADLNLNILNSPADNRTTIGFVENNSKIIHTYYNFLSSLSKIRLAGHFAHEWTHLLGFKHPIDTGTNAAFLARTVPYAVESIVLKYLDLRFEELMLKDNNVA